MLSKRGISTIVTTLIIVLVTMVAVGIIWVVIQNVLRSGAEQVELGKYSLDLEIKSVQVNGENVTVTIKRNPGQGDFVGINFIFFNGTDSEIIRQNVSMNQLEQKIFTFNLENINASTLSGVSVVPIYETSSGKESVGNPTDTVTAGGTGFGSGSASGGGTTSGGTTGGATTFCGDLVCNGTETSSSCPIDCPSVNQISITNCREITSSGSYVLQNNLTGGNTAPCLNIHDTSQVYIDCANNNISSNYIESIRIINVNNFSLKNCKIKGLVNNNLVKIQESSNGLVSDNIFINSSYQQNASDNIIIKNNNFKEIPLSTGLLGVVISNFGFNNQIINNLIDGSSTGIYSEYIGANDGIVISDEKNDLIKNNTILNTWDCGIETTGLTENNNITNNTIKNAGNSGIGGWYVLSLKNNTIENNIVENADTIFLFFRADLLLPSEEKMYFRDNVFRNNKLINPKLRQFDGDINSFGRAAMDTSAQFNLNNAIGFADPVFILRFTPEQIDFGNNLIINNNFSTIKPPPVLSPSGAFINGGGNTCGAPSIFPLASDGQVYIQSYLQCTG